MCSKKNKILQLCSRKYTSNSNLREGKSYSYSPVILIIVNNEVISNELLEVGVLNSPRWISCVSPLPDDNLRSIVTYENEQNNGIKNIKILPQRRSIRKNYMIFFQNFTQEPRKSCILTIIAYKIKINYSNISTCVTGKFWNLIIFPRNFALIGEKWWISKGI